MSPSFFDLLYHIRQAITGLRRISVAAILLCMGLTANAAEPDYIGPYKYFGAEDKKFHDALSAAESIFQWHEGHRIRLGEGSLCNYHMTVMKPEEWILRDSTDASMGSVEVSSLKYYLYQAYNKGDTGACDGPLYSSAIGVIAVRRKRVVCSTSNGTRYFAPADECRPGHFEPQSGAHGGNVGPQCPKCNDSDVGQPITPATGNMWHAITDYQSPQSTSDLTLRRI